MSQSLGRTIRNSITLYIRDGQGRDGYIAYNNGGFWKDPDGIGIKKLEYDHPIHSNFHSLIHPPAPFNYIRDGSGRDNYIAYNNGGLTKGFVPNFKMDLITFLRNDNEKIPLSHRKKYILNKREISHLGILKKIQNGVIKRLYENEKGKFIPVKIIRNNKNDDNNLPQLNSSRSVNFIRKYDSYNNKLNKSKLFNSSCINFKLKPVFVNRNHLTSSRSTKNRISIFKDES